MMALDPSRIEFLIPLLLVLVQQFAALTRNLTEDLTEVRNNPPLIIPVSPTDGEHSPLKQWLPQLGRLNVLHTTNMGLLTAAYV